MMSMIDQLQEEVNETRRRIVILRHRSSMIQSSISTIIPINPHINEWLSTWSTFTAEFHQPERSRAELTQSLFRVHRGLYQLGTNMPNPDIFDMYSFWTHLTQQWAQGCDITSDLMYFIRRWNPSSPRPT